MDDSRAPLAAFALAGTLNLAQAAYYWRLLPERAASHFVASGAPNAWMPRNAFVGLYAGAVVFLGVMMLTAGFSLESRPDARINLPHKEYWLAPERRAETFAYFRRWFLWFGAATFALFFDVFGQAFRVSLGQAAGLDRPKLDLALYVGAALVLVVRMLRRFGKPAGASLRRA